MNVGILTFHRAENFGAVLQAFALQTFLENEGCKVSIIDYRNHKIDAMYDIFNPRILFTRKNVFASLHLYLSRFKNIRDRKICKKKYEDFRRNFFHLTDKFQTLKKSTDFFDYVIVGSDQVWNLHLTGGLDRNYFLDFAKDTKTKKIAYAASAEKDPAHLLLHHKKTVSRLLDDFDVLSVREDFLKDELKDYTAKEIKVCLDPTFLLNGNSYVKLASTVPDYGYVLVYHMTPIPSGSVLAEKIATSKNLKIKEIHIGYGYGKGDERHKVNLGPLEILNYIAHAQEVITSSFHGLALSIILKKNVWVIDKGNNLRQRNLLSHLGLENHLLTCVEDYDGDKIDYNSVDSKLNQLIKDSKEFIRNAIFD